jgi:hypothetical protein
LLKIAARGDCAVAAPYIADVMSDVRTVADRNRAEVRFLYNLATGRTSAWQRNPTSLIRRGRNTLCRQHLLFGAKPRWETVIVKAFGSSATTNCE